MPLTLDVFNDDAFSAVSLTQAIEKFEYVPSYLGSVTASGRPLFEFNPIETTDVAVETLDNTLSLIPLSERGAAPKQKNSNKRKMRNFSTGRLAVADKIRADELQNIRAFGKTTELEMLQRKLASKQMRLRQDVETTLEYIRLGAVQGLMLDPGDGSTVIDYYSAFNVTKPTEVDFDLDNASPTAGAVRKKCADIKRAVLRELGSLAVPGTEVMAICGDEFWDELITHPHVEDTYKNYEAATALRSDITWQEFTFGGIRWTNYRGTDDNSKVAVGSQKAKFFPAGAPGVFQMAHAPAETFEFVNTPGLEVYSFIKPDTKNNTHADIELYSYPLAICTRPKSLQSARMT